MASPRQPFDSRLLDEAGLNLQAVFDVAALPAPVAASLARAAPGHGRRQLILLGHGGRRLWQAVQAAGLESDHPIDDFTIASVGRWFAAVCPGLDFRLLYPGDAPVGLQQLGQVAGWHHPSPFMVGVRQQWGSWYAYRAALLADSDFLPTPPLQEASPCASCGPRVCIEACPAGALAGGRFDLAACIAWRRQPASPCRHACLARLACPVGREHRYEPAQIRHTYAQSLAAIEAYY